ncbi:hypothetical protein F5Y07DRAFT_394522 [Xylaria sp. FL0933]|nr:hypothetical protein F5Y07DRAFT_394522 [Xylaria sp. FL0933]
MADIASIVFSAISATQKSSIAIYKFSRGCKEARSDLTNITQELSELKLILELISDSNNGTFEGLPASLQPQLKEMLASCETVVKDIEKIIENCNRRTGVLRWTLVDKEKVTTMKVSLEAFKSGLSLSLDTANLSLAKGIKNNTDAIHDDTAEIRRDTEQILDEIQRLRIQLPHDGYPDEQRSRLEAWLDTLTHYAETIVGDETVNQFDDPLPVGYEDDNEIEVSRQSKALITLTQSITGGMNGFAHSAGSGTPSLSEASPATSYPAVSSAATPEDGHSLRQKESYFHLIVSLPCVSNVISWDGNVERQICVTLHNDSIIRIWSMHKKQLIKELKPNVLVSGKFSVIHLASPEIIILLWIQAGVRSIFEAWNWVDGHYIGSIVPPWGQPHNANKFDQQQVFVPGFPHLYTNIFSLFGPEQLAIVNFDVLPKEAIRTHCTPLLTLATSENEGAASDRGRLGALRFVSEREAALLWTLPTLRTFISKNKKSKFFVEMARFSSITGDNDRKVSVSEKYSPSIIKHARVTAKVWLPSEVQSIRAFAVFPQVRTVFIGVTHKPQTLADGNVDGYIMKLDSGDLVPVHSPRKGQVIYHGESCMVYRDSKDKAYVISMKDGHELGTFDISGQIFMESSDAFFLVRRRGSDIQFGKRHKPWVLERG